MDTKIKHDLVTKLKARPKFNPIRIANSIVVGGMIAFGKSTLVQALADKLKTINIVEEFNENDELSNLLLSKMYSRENNLLFGSVFQLYFVLQRFHKYKTNCNQEQLTIFDRSIFEDWIFAHENIIRPSVFRYYENLWKDISNELIYEHGVPKLYIILSGDWDLFKKRLFERNRQSEIENFEKNRLYFKKLLSLYQEYMVNVCNDFGIKYLIIDAKLELDQKVELIVNKLKTLNSNV